MAGKIPPQFIDQLLNRIDIVDLINGRLPLKKGGRDYQACCPFHDEKTPSFTVSRSKQFYHCFGCGAHGTAIGFLMEYENIGFLEAVEELAKSVNLDVPRTATERQGPDLRPLYECLAQAAKYYQAQLRSHPEAARAVVYLKNRGVSGRIAAEFGIGYAPPGFNNLVASLSPAADAGDRLLKAGMTAQSEEGRRYDRFRDRIMFPIRNHRGLIIGFGGRLLGEGNAKYLNSPETPLFQKGRELYGLHEARKANRRLERLLVVEGYMDVIALAQSGIRYAVATLGTATTEAHLERLFRTVSEVIFCFDGDRAGREAGWKALETSLPSMRDGREIRFLFLPEGEDPDSYVRKHGAEKFQALVAGATPLSEYFFDRLTGEVDMSSLGGRAQLAERAKPMLKRLPRGVFSRMMYQLLSKKIGIEIESSPSRQFGGKSKKPSRPSLDTIPPVRRAIALLVSNPALAQRENLPKGWEKLPKPGIPLLRELLELLRTQPNITSAGLLERWRDREEGRHLGKLNAMMLPLPDEDQATEFNDTLSLLSAQALKSEWQELVDKAERSGLNESEKQRLGELTRLKAKRDNDGTSMDQS